MADGSEGRPTNRGALRDGLPVVGVGLLCVAACLAHGLREAPIFWDRAYFTVLAQGILRGESIYATSFMGYPPMGLLVSAGAMGVARELGLPTYVAPRYLAVAAAALSAALLCVVTRRACGSRWAGVMAGVALAAFMPFVRSTVSTLEPKHLVVLCAVGASWAVQRRRWVWAGAAGSCAAACWQPAGLLPLALAPSVLAGGAEGRGRRVAAYAAGLLAGALPSLLYLTVHDAWFPFFERAVLIPASSDLADAGGSLLKWIAVAWHEYSGQRGIFVLAALGLAGFSAISLLGWLRAPLAAWTDARLGAMPLTAVAWCLWSALQVDAYPDLFPMLPAVAFWCAWLCHRAVTRLLPREAQPWAGAALVGLVLLYGLGDRGTGPLPRGLSWEKTVIEHILSEAPEGGTVLALSVEEIYAIAELRPPVPYLRLTNAFMPFLDGVEPGGCRGVQARLRRERPALVAVRLWRRSSACERSVGRLLEADGYEHRRVPFHGQLDVYVRRDPV